MYYRQQCIKCILSRVLKQIPMGKNLVYVKPEFTIAFRIPFPSIYDNIVESNNRYT